MKKFTKILALTLVVAMCAVMLVSCSSYGKIKKAFEAEGYTLQNPDNEPTKTIETESGDVTVTVHTFQKEAESTGNVLEDALGGIGQLASTAIVWEFSSSADLDKALESDTVKGIIKDAQKSDVVNGNCILTTINADAIAIFKGTK